MQYFTGTNSSFHTFLFNRIGSGDYNYYVGCQDEAGNSAYGNTSFKVEADSDAPRITSAFKDSTTGNLKIEVDEEQTDCRVSVDDPNFNFEDGNQMLSQGERFFVSQEQSSIYYVQCKDKYGNKSPITSITFI